MMLDQVCDNEGDTPRDASHAMNQNISPFYFFLDEFVRVLKIVAQIKGLMIDCWNIQILNVPGDHFVQILPLYCCYYCLNV